MQSVKITGTSAQSKHTPFSVFLIRPSCRGVRGGPPRTDRPRERGDSTMDGKTTQAGSCRCDKEKRLSGLGVRHRCRSAIPKVSAEKEKRRTGKLNGKNKKRSLCPCTVPKDNPIFSDGPCICFLPSVTKRSRNLWMPKPNLGSLTFALNAMS